LNRAAPLAIKNYRQQQHLLLQWNVDEVQQLSSITLRGACPCATCRTARLRGKISLVDESVQIKDIANMVYGLQLVFSDGHDRGIYPWSYLFELTGSSEPKEKTLDV